MVDESMWLDVDLPMELRFKMERVCRLVDGLDEDELRVVARASLVHNFHLMHYAKQSVKRVAELEEEDERPKSERKTRKAPSKSGKVQK